MEIDKKSVAFRLKSFLVDKFGSVKAAAVALDKSPEALYNGYLNGRSVPGGELLAQLAELDCDIEWLLTGRTRTIQPQAAKLFPVVSAVGAGSVTPYDDIISEPIPMPYNGEGVLLRVVGDSMAALIQEGDLVLVDSKKKPKEGNIVAVRTKAGEQFVKYLGARSKQTVMFYSHNSIYAPVTYQISDLVTVKKVVLILKDVDFT